MTRVLRGLLYGAIAGLLLATTARVLMRMVAFGMDRHAEFDPVATVSLAALFMLSGAGAGMAGAAGLRTWKLALVLAVTSGLLLLTGTVFGLGETLEIYNLELPLVRTVLLTALSLIIFSLVLATPYAGLRLGRLAARQQAVGQLAA